MLHTSCCCKHVAVEATGAPVYSGMQHRHRVPYYCPLHHLRQPALNRHRLLAFWFYHVPYRWYSVVVQMNRPAIEDSFTRLSRLPKLHLKYILPVGSLAAITVPCTPTWHSAPTLIMVTVGSVEPGHLKLRCSKTKLYLLVQCLLMLDCAAVYCHCSTCQSWCGAAFLHSITFPPDKVRLFQLLLDCWLAIKLLFSDVVFVVLPVAFGKHALSSRLFLTLSIAYSLGYFRLSFIAVWLEGHLLVALQLSSALSKRYCPALTLGC